MPTYIINGKAREPHNEEESKVFASLCAEGIIHLEPVETVSSGMEIEKDNIKKRKAEEIATSTTEPSSPEHKKANKGDKTFESDSKSEHSRSAGFPSPITMASGSEAGEVNDDDTIEIDDDGNCLFRAIVEGVKYSEIGGLPCLKKHEDLRDQTVRWLAELKDKTCIINTLSYELNKPAEEVSPEDINRYLKGMSENETWGGTPELMIIALMLGKKIIIREKNEHDENIYIQIPPGEEYKSWDTLVKLSRVNASGKYKEKNHYNLILSKKQKILYNESISKNDTVDKEKKTSLMHNCRLDESKASVQQQIRIQSKNHRILGCFNLEGTTAITINNQRLPTSQKGGAQGDHITAYAVMLQMLCGIIDGEEMETVPDFLYEVSALLVEDKENFKAIKEIFDSKKAEIEKSLVPKKPRKLFTASLRNIVASETAKKIKKDETIDDTSLKAAVGFISEMNECNLVLMSDLPSTGPAKNTIYLEKSGDRLKYIVLDPKDTTDKPKIIESTLAISISEDELTQAKLDSLVPDILMVTSERGHNSCNKDGFSINFVRDILKERNLSLYSDLVAELGNAFIAKLSKDALTALPKLIKIPRGENEALLSLKILNRTLLLQKELNTEGYDTAQAIEDYRENYKQIVKQSYPNTEKEDTLNDRFKKTLSALCIGADDIHLTDENLTAKILALKVKPEAVGSLFNRLFDFDRQNIVKRDLDDSTIEEGGKTLDNKIAFESPNKTLYQVSAKHLNIMFLAFKGLKNLPAENKEAFVESFLNCVIEEQNWGTYEISRTLRAKQYLDAKTILSEIRTQLITIVGLTAEPLLDLSALVRSSKTDTKPKKGGPR